jgi:hypothetical protein
VDGTALPATVSVAAHGWSDVPAPPGEDFEGAFTISVRASASSEAKTTVSPMASTLTIGRASDVLKAPMHLLIPVSVHVRESTPGDAPTVVDTWLQFPTKELTWHDPYAADKAKCDEKLREWIVSHELYKRIRILLTLPDPAPDWVLRALEFGGQVERELAAVRAVDPEIADALAKRLFGPERQQ